MLIFVLYLFVTLFMFKILRDIESRYPWSICSLLMLILIWKEELLLINTANGIFFICIFNYLILFLTICFLILSEIKYKKQINMK